MDSTATNDTRSYHATVSLRIWHPRMRCEEITNAIGLLPSLCHDVGNHRKSPTGQLLEGFYPQTYWVHEYTFKEDNEVEDCIMKAVDTIKMECDFLKQIASTGGRCELFIGVFLEKDAGIVLNQVLIREVANAGLELSFDLYVPEAKQMGPVDKGKDGRAKNR